MIHLNLNNATFGDICAVGTLVFNLEKRIDSLEAALAADQGGSIYAWEKYSLGVAGLKQGNWHVTSVEAASLTTKTGGLVFRNGAGERAVLMSRRHALECALRNVSASLAHFEVHTRQIWEA